LNIALPPLEFVLNGLVFLSRPLSRARLPMTMIGGELMNPVPSQADGTRALSGRFSESQM